MCCPEDWETRHPLDFYTTRNDTHLLPWTRPDNDGIDVGPTYINPLNPSGLPHAFCTLVTVKALADQGSADCATLTI